MPDGASSFGVPDIRVRTLTDDTLRWVGFLSGAFAGGVRVFVGHPFDSLKVRMQTGERLPQVGVHGFISLYRGILPPLASIGVLTSMNFGLYENTRVSIMQNMKGIPTVPQQLWIEFIAGTVAGSTMAALTIPLENIKMVVAPHYLRPWGLQGWFRGLVPHLVQAGIGRGFYLGGYFMCKAVEDGDLLPIGINKISYGEKANSETVIGKMLAGAGAGVCGWTFTYPFDVVRNNVMRDWKRERHHSTLGCFRNLIETGGLRQLYAGFGFTLARGCAVACITLPSYDMARRALLNLASTSGIA
ncbi:hypothetical protein AAMO2058_001660100 [Amorphochlora amoebiformis]